MFLGCNNTKKHDVPQVVELYNNWQFKKVKDTTWYATTIPSNVHSDLLKHKLIEHPFIGNNEEKLQWISETDWAYKTTFSVDAKTLQKKHLELQFKGLDTYATIKLNGKEILKTNNAFRTYTISVKATLKAENTLEIFFEHPAKYEEIAKSKLPYTLPEGNRIFTRKAQFQYGWDWGPKLNTMGVWRPITLTAFNDYKIRNVNIKQQKLTDEVADLAIEISKTSSIELDKQLTYDVYVNDSLYKTSNEIFKGATWLTSLQIKNPKRWWPHTIGKPFLYKIKVVAKKNNTILDSISLKKGLRTVNLVQEKDCVGSSFYFNINGKPVYAKGANYIPQHSLQDQVKSYDYEVLLDNTVKSNMNMLRVWGGGIYENDEFYELCDEKGVMVWQDFMFACAMYLGDNAFLKNVTKEAEDNVKRLRNHASIVLWCGNNESSEGWHRWGWQDGRSEAEKEEIWGNYLKVFDSILPKTVKKYANNIPYWESSPSYGRGNPKYEFEGDAHDWWIWHDAYPFEHLEQKVPRFMSEFGFQSFPSYEAINYINQKDTVSITDASFQSHQKHSRGFKLIREYMERDFPVPTAAQDYVYVSQLVQAHGILKGVEAQRRSKPYNMGTLYWQLNDCWPVVSWSSIDYFGNKKALYYQSKRAFDNVLISPVIQNNVIKTYIVNDEFTPKKGTLTQQIVSFDGAVIYDKTKEIKVPINSSLVVETMNLGSVKFNPLNHVLVTTFNGKIAYKYFSKPKDLQLLTTAIETVITKTDNGFLITLKTDKLAKDVFLCTEVKGDFSDNFFDILPNSTKVIEFETKAKSLDDLKLKVLNTIN